MKYIASCSFGKDSLAMLIKIKELGLPLDEVVYCDIRFDKETSGEKPEVEAFIQHAEKILKDKFGIIVTHISGVTFKDQFYTVKKRGKHKGEIYGFPIVICAWCNSYLKKDVLKKYYRQFNEPVKQYVGIAYNEPERYERLNHETYIAPLYDLKITEQEAMEICKEHDLVSPVYEKVTRSGCWFCPKQSFASLKQLYLNYNDLWNKLKEMEKDSFNTFRYGYTMQELEERFKKG